MCGKEQFSINKELLVVITKSDQVIDIKIAKPPSKLYNKAVFFSIVILITILNSFAFLTNIVGLKTLIITALLTVICVIFICGKTLEEHLTVFKHLGYQITTISFRGQKTVFIPYKNVKQIFINEVIFHQKVIFVFTMMVSQANRTTLIPLFMEFQPRLKYLEDIYKAVQRS